MMGTAAAVDAPLPVITGAIISGAYLCDKMPPLSDSTVLAAVAADVDVDEHSRHKLYNAVPSFIVALTVYALVGQFGGAAGAALFPRRCHGVAEGRIQSHDDRVHRR